jgi:hypothetical protein
MRMNSLSLLLLTAATNVFCLTAPDLVGTWVAEGLDGDGSKMEIWYGADGSREVRSAAVYGDVDDYRLQTFGTWELKTDAVVEKTTGGWISFGGSTDPVQPDGSASTSKVALAAGSPAKLTITDCDGPCADHVFTFVSADKQFSLPSLDAPTSAFARAGTASARRAFHLVRQGRGGFRILFQNRSFDIRGRMTGLGAIAR